MKTVPKDIEDVFSAVRDLVKDQIANVEWASPIEPDTLSDKTIAGAKEFLYQKNQDDINYKIYSARFFIILTALIMIEMGLNFDEENPSTILKPIAHSILLMALLFYYETKIGPIPLEGNLNKLILPKKEYEKRQRYINLEYMRNDAIRKSPLKGWSLIFAGEKLERMFEIRDINPMIHESIVFALSSLKHKSFTCVSVAAVTLLKLIEQKVPYTLNWYYKPGNSFDGHNFIIATDNEKNSFIVDPWYGVCADSEQMSVDDFKLQYPLLALADKAVLATITPNHFKYYRGYIELLNEAMPQSKRDLRV